MQAQSWGRAWALEQDTDPTQGQGLTSEGTEQGTQVRAQVLDSATGLLN